MESGPKESGPNESAPEENADDWVALEFGAPGSFIREFQQASEAAPVSDNDDPLLSMMIRMRIKLSPRGGL